MMYFAVYCLNEYAYYDELLQQIENCNKYLKFKFLFGLKQVGQNQIWIGRQPYLATIQTR